MDANGEPDNPFVDHAPIGNQPLVDTPLVVMFVQVRYSAVDNFEPYAQHIAKSLRATYPVKESGLVQQIQIGADQNVSAQPAEPVMTLRPINDGLTVTIARDSIAIESRIYPGRRDLLRVIEREAGAGNVDMSVGYIGMFPTNYPIQAVHQFTSGPDEAIMKVLRI